MKQRTKIKLLTVLLSVSIILLILYFILLNVSTNQKANLFKNIQDGDNIQVSFTGSQLIINATVAISNQAREYGLKNRTKLDQFQGMFFIFEKENFLSFWMQDTLISLDIIFMDKDFKINTIHRNTKINQTQELYISSQKSQYVLEVLAGTSDKYNIKVGDTITVRY